MRPIKQAKDFSVCINGYTLPKNAIYGNVYGVTYVCTNFNTVRINKRAVYKIRIWDEPTRRWINTDTEKHGAIFVRIRDFMKTADFVNAPIVLCEHKTAKREELERAAERVEKIRSISESKKRREWERENMVDAPREKRSQLATGTMLHYANSCYSQSCIEGKSYNSEKYADSVHELKPHEHGYAIPKNNKRFNVDQQFSRFEMGQTTCGTADTKYGTRSGWETKQDGFKVDFVKACNERRRKTATK